jgi:hypothetical protein
VKLENLGTLPEVTAPPVEPAEREPEYLDQVAALLQTEEGRAVLRGLVDVPPVEWMPTPEAE